MSVARTGLPHTRTPATAIPQARGADRTTATAPHRPPRSQPHPSHRPAAVALSRRGLGRRRRTLRPHPAAVRTPRLQPSPQPRSAAGGNGSRPARDSRARVRELVERERATGTRLAARDVAAQVGISERRAYELLRDLRQGVTNRW
jgi:hypothetical protein